MKCGATKNHRCKCCFAVFIGTLFLLMLRLSSDSYRSNNVPPKTSRRSGCHIGLLGYERSLSWCFVVSSSLALCQFSRLRNYEVSSLQRRGFSFWFSNILEIRNRDSDVFENFPQPFLSRQDACARALHASFLLCALADFAKITRQKVIAALILETYILVSRPNGLCCCVAILSTRTALYHTFASELQVVYNYHYGTQIMLGFTWISIWSPFVSSKKQQKGLRRPSTQQGRRVSSFFRRHC